MKYVRLSACLAILLLLLFGCSIDISQNTAATSTPGVQNSASTVPPSTPGSVAAPSQTAVSNTSQIPVTWGNLDLTGKLIYIAAIAQNEQLSIEVQSLDLTNGQVTTIFRTTGEAWLDSATVSPDLQQLILSYTPPAGVPYSGQDALYSMPLNGSSAPQLLFPPASDEDQYYQPQWSPNGKYIYFTHLLYQGSNPYEMMRVAYPNGTPEKISDNAYWPRLSQDGTRLVYVSYDSLTGINHLFIANPDGANAHQVPLTGPAIPTVIDAPMFSSDGRSIIFSAPDPPSSSYQPNWLVSLFGATDAFADGSIPSDWWTVPVTGGAPRQLTTIYATSLYGTYSPDRKYIACYSANGVFVMRPDGTGITQIVSRTGGIPGTVNWIP